MQDAVTIARIRDKYFELLDDLDERGRRRWAAVEARALGWGGVTAVAKATGLSDRTIRNGIKELDDPAALASDRQRKPGAGRKPLEQTQAGLRKALEALIDPTTRGSPTNPLRWTIKSTARLADELQKQGFAVSATSVRRLLVAMKYSLQGNRISERVKARQRRGEPAISVDTKKKEVLGNLKNPGKTYRPQGQPLEVNTHDFPDKTLGKAVPYGVYDIHLNEAGVSVGISHDTAQFAVAAIRRWWTKLGQKKYAQAKRITITADSGGSNSSRSRLWKVELQKWADETGLIVEVCHFPPGTSKWNKIEHRVFCHITQNWRGTPLETLDVVVQSIGATTTQAGLEVHAWLDRKTYPKGQTVSDEQLAECHLKPNKYHGEWNYEIHPRA
jgi:transposase